MHPTDRPRGTLVLVLALACSPAAPQPTPTPEKSPPVPAAEPPPPPVPERPLTLADREAAGGRIVFLAERDDGATIEQILPSGQDPKTLHKGPALKEGASVYPGPAAPDGARIIITTVENQGGEHLERLELRPLSPDGTLGEPEWRSEPGAQVRNPAWSRDGRFFVYEASFPNFRDLYRVDLRPGGPPSHRPLTNEPAGNYEPAISPDGARIAFVSSRDGNAEIYVMSADGEIPAELGVPVPEDMRPKRLTNFHLDDFGPLWSPDGKTLVFLSNREGADRIFLSNPDGSEQRRLTPDALNPDAGFEPAEAEPAFSPDGRLLAYSVRTGPSRASIRVFDLSTGARTHLTPGTHSDRSPVWSPRGDLLVFASDRDGDPELYLVRPDATGTTRLTSRPGPDWLPRWLPR
jgi:TolB protein